MGVFQIKGGTSVGDMTCFSNLRKVFQFSDIAVQVFL
jgi:acyl-[acyl carrier protein]--UDP-N-acetylglucosamine O-acyltransferase